jgi:hypothetical protein
MENNPLRRCAGSPWQDPGLWIALGVSALFIVVGVAMHRVFVKILKQPPAGADKADPHE